MTLLNHIGVFVLILLTITLLDLLQEKVRNAYSLLDQLWLIPTVSIFLWSIFEAFYWTFKVFF